MPQQNGLDSLVRNIGIISRNNSVLASMLSHLTAGDEPTEPRELRVLLQDTGLIARETGELLLSLQQDVSHEAGAAPDRQRSMLNKLNKDFQFVLRRFQQLAEQSAQHARLEDLEAARPKSAVASSPSGAVYDEEDIVNEQGPLLAGEDPLGHQQQQQQRQAAMSGVEAMAERERMISQVETTVIEVKEIFSELATIVSEQTEQIEHISSAIENTADKAHRATDELRDASRAQALARKRKCCMYGAGLAGVIIFLSVMFVNMRL
mmetsp:Transcript_17069/g.43847  ORF Transcript_17069/g.43847 Transcript_17069/m.43847 type:complete len:264 (+) Transcript_17069:126-917(+)